VSATGYLEYNTVQIMTLCNVLIVYKLCMCVYIYIYIHTYIMDTKCTTQCGRFCVDHTELVL